MLAYTAHHELQTPITPRGRRSLLISAGLFLALLIVRTYDITRTFRLLGDQVRDWRIALGPLIDLPLVGTSSTAGGTTLGPIFYWVLWLFRVVIGPFCDNLPHAGGIGIALLQSTADVALFRGLARRFENQSLAAAAVVLAATSPYDLALSATIWNPPVAVAFVKFTMAATLRSTAVPTLWRVATVSALGWFAVQAHSPALFVTAPMILWAVAAQMRQRGRIVDVFHALRAAIETIAVLQIPFLLGHLRTGPGPEANPFTRAVIHAVQEPGSLQVAESWRALSTAVDVLMFNPLGFPLAGAALVVCAVLVAWRFRKDPPVLAVTIAPVFVTWVGFWLLDRPLTERYWYVSLMPAVALLLVVACCSVLRGRHGRFVAPAVLVAVLVWTPFRVAAGWAIAPFPQYGILVAASREIRERTPEVRGIIAPFLPPSTDPVVIYEILGGRVTTSATLVAVVGGDGTVSYRVER